MQTQKYTDALSYETYEMLDQMEAAGYCLKAVAAERAKSPSERKAAQDEWERLYKRHWPDSCIEDDINRIEEIIDERFKMHELYIGEATLDEWRSYLIPETFQEIYNDDLAIRLLRYGCKKDHLKRNYFYSPSWLQQYRDDYMMKDDKVYLGGFDNDNPTPKVVSPETSINPMKIPGLIGDTIRDIVAKSQKEQPELAMLNVFAAAGAVFGRRYRSPMNTRTNLYAVGIASTSGGKDHSRRYIKQLLGDADLDIYLGGDMIVSGAGLLTSINKRPSQVMHLDEFGMLLEGMLDQKGAAHLKIASKIITELYSSSGGTYFGGQYADPKSEPFRIQFPNLCVYGTTTFDKYVSAMNKKVIASGELNRWIVLRPKIEQPQRKKYMGAATPSESIVNAWKKLLPGGKVEALNHGIITPETIEVPWTGLEDRIWEMGLFEDEQNKKAGEAGALWGRYRENCIKIAMILAIARDPEKPCIVAEDFDIAEKIVQQAVNFMVTLANEHMADSEHEKNCNRIMQAIKKCGGEINGTKLWGATRSMTQKHRDEAIRSLIDEGVIAVSKHQTGGASARRYSFVKKSKNAD